MFCISYNRAISDDWRKRTTLAEPEKRRIYRWGSHWLQVKEGKKPLCEKRTTHRSSDAMIVEVCDRVSCTIPKEMDDIWEEEVVIFPNGLEYNGLVFLRGGDEVLEIAASQGLPLPVLPTTQTCKNTKTHINKNSKNKMKYKCLIQD